MKLISMYKCWNCKTPFMLLEKNVKTRFGSGPELEDKFMFAIKEKVQKKMDIIKKNKSWLIVGGTEYIEKYIICEKCGKEHPISIELKKNYKIETNPPKTFKESESPLLK